MREYIVHSVRHKHLAEQLADFPGTRTVIGAALPVLGVAVIAAFNAFYWLPIRGESPLPRTS
jgi:hypothetical protein